MLNKQKGNMYPWVTHTWNVIKGKCPHDCIYCYMKSYPQPTLHFDEKELKTDLGSGNTIFVGSSCDMWAESIPGVWLEKILDHCFKYDNRYLFQTKNPARFNCLDKWDSPNDTIIGCTIETNRVNAHGEISNAPNTYDRYKAMCYLGGLPKMVSIEPILEFDLGLMVSWIKDIEPQFVSIGADSKGHHLPEPPGDKVRALISELQGITEVKIKSNLNRILRGNHA